MRRVAPSGTVLRGGVAFAFAVALAQLLSMKSGLAQDGRPLPNSVPEDWSSRHVIYSGARTAGDSQRMSRESRYRNQWLLRNRPGLKGQGSAMEQMSRLASAAAGVTPPQIASPGSNSTIASPPQTMVEVMSTLAATVRRGRPTTTAAARADWGISLGAGGTVGAEMFPAKWNFDTTASPSCANDFAVFNTSLVPSSPTTGTGGAVIVDTSSTTPGAGTIMVGRILYNVDPDGAVAAPGAAGQCNVTFTGGGSNSANRNIFRTNLAAAINNPGAGSGSTYLCNAAVNGQVSATNDGSAQVNLTALAAGLIPLTTTSPNTSVNDFTGDADGNSSIIAYNNLYSPQGAVAGFCGTNGPTVTWSYNTGTGRVVTSPVLSLDGKKVIYVETKAGGAVLHVLQVQAGDGTQSAPATPDLVMNAPTAWSGCSPTQSCDMRVDLNGTATVTNSAPFYDYDADALYVGDDAGVLHKISPVIAGTPAEVVTGNWPITVNTGVVLSSPVLDRSSGNIFIGDASGRLSFVRETYSNQGACGSGSAPCLGSKVQALGGAVVDPPIVDGSAHRVFAFEGKDTTVKTPNAVPISKGRVFQYDTALTDASERVASVGSASITTPVNIHAGAFDQAYLSSALGTGSLYVCGKQTTGSIDLPAIHRITITAGTMNTSSDGSRVVAATSNAECSPVTSVYNAPTGTEHLFFSVGDSSNQSAAGCTTGEGCLMSLNLTALGGSWPPAAVTRGFRVPTVSGGAGTSGIIVDNTVLPTATTLAPSSSTSLVGGVATTLSAATGPTAQEATIVFGGSRPASGSTVVIGSMTYGFTNTASPLALPSGNVCNVRSSASFGDSTTTVANNLRGAITNGNSGGSTTTYRCGTASGNALVTAGGSGTTVTATAVTPGATGFTFSTSGITNFSSASITIAGANASTSISVASTTGMAVSDVIQIDSEKMTISVVNSGTQLTVARGAQSTTVASHASGTSVLDLTVGTATSTLTLASTSSIATGEYLQIDSEKVLVTAVNSPRVTVTRAQLSTVAAAHATTATVSHLTTASGDTTLFTANTSGFNVNDYVQVDSEIMRVTAISPNTSFTVTRGQLGSAAAAHVSPVSIFDINAQTSSIYFSFLSNSASGVLCNGVSGVGCGVKLTQLGLQ